MKEGLGDGAVDHVELLELVVSDVQIVPEVEGVLVLIHVCAQEVEEGLSLIEKEGEADEEELLLNHRLDFLLDLDHIVHQQVVGLHVALQYLVAVVLDFRYDNQVEFQVLLRDSLRHFALHLFINLFRFQVHKDPLVERVSEDDLGDLRVDFLLWFLLFLHGLLSHSVVSRRHFGTLCLWSWRGGLTLLLLWSGGIRLALHLLWPGRSQGTFLVLFCVLFWVLLELFYLGVVGEIVVEVDFWVMLHFGIARGVFRELDFEQLGPVFDAVEGNQIFHQLQILVVNVDLGNLNEEVVVAQGFLSLEELPELLQHFPLGDLVVPKRLRQSVFSCSVLESDLSGRFVLLMKVKYVNVFLDLDVLSDVQVEETLQVLPLRLQELQEQSHFWVLRVLVHGVNEVDQVLHELLLGVLELELEEPVGLLRNIYLVSSLRSHNHPHLLIVDLLHCLQHLSP